MFEGTATHLGYHTGSAFNCVDLATFQLLTTSQEVVAANGDKLFFSGSIGDGTVMVIDWADPDLSFEILGLTFVGGTGRFENASGWLDLSSEALSSECVSDAPDRMELRRPSAVLAPLSNKRGGLRTGR
jgi:hypothetical protein